MNETVQVKVLNNTFIVKTKKGSDYIRNIESYVNNKIQMIRGDRILNDEECIETVLKACLAIADDYMSLKEDVAEYEKDLGGIVKQIH